MLMYFKKKNFPRYFSAPWTRHCLLHVSEAWNVAHPQYCLSYHTTA